MKSWTYPLLLACLGPSAAFADTPSQRWVDQLRADGYERIEVKTGRSQTKIEALRGLREFEVVFDTRSGLILEQEFELYEDDDHRPGVFHHTLDRDFLDHDDLYDDDDRYDDDRYDD